MADPWPDQDQLKSEEQRTQCDDRLEDPAVDNAWSASLHSLCAMTICENVSNDPNNVFPLWRCDDLALHGRRREAENLLLSILIERINTPGLPPNDVRSVQLNRAKLTSHNRSARFHARGKEGTSIKSWLYQCTLI
jgi:hypothetical protein